MQALPLNVVVKVVVNPVHQAAIPVIVICRVSHAKGIKGGRSLFIILMVVVVVVNIKAVRRIVIALPELV